MSSSTVVQGEVKQKNVNFDLCQVLSALKSRRNVDNNVSFPPFFIMNWMFTYVWKANEFVLSEKILKEIKMKVVAINSPSNLVFYVKKGAFPVLPSFSVYCNSN